MKILITGANGFIGKNLKEQLARLEYVSTIYEYDIDTEESLLDEYTRDCDFVFHLAGINRPKNEEEFMEGNCYFTKKLTQSLIGNNNYAPIAVSSSIQAELDNMYGASKRAGEDVLREYSQSTGAKVVIYRFPNVFGKWCRPNYNSAVATFCHNIARDIPIVVNDENVLLHLVYIDDVCTEFIDALNGNEHIADGYGFVPTV